ncbi:FAD/NAD(P)-binding domain-containing protein [Phlegmacium glaucopus]|nr:FAD/NAD(P)-binding domain-containing protein [Phlegmacium glaucopus]
MQDLGLDEEVRKRNIPLPKEGGRNHGTHFSEGQSEGCRFRLSQLVMPYGPTSLSRPVLLDMLKAQLSDRCTTHTSKRLIEYQVEVTQSITLVFSDGSTASADVLIGADGVHSLTRAAMYKTLASSNPAVGYDQFIDPIWSGTFAYRCRVDLARPKSLYPEHQAISHPKIWCGKNKHIVSHPFGNIINLVCFFTVETGAGTPYHGAWVTDVSPTEVIDCYKNWEPDLLQLLEHLEKPSRWAIHVVRPIPFSVLGRVALLGDAAHAMTPYQGVGGGQAIEDAHILGHLLSIKNAATDQIEDILRIYQEVRLLLAAKAAERSHTNGLFFFFFFFFFLISI